MGNYFDDRFLEDSDSDEEDGAPKKKNVKKAKNKKKDVDN